MSPKQIPFLDSYWKMLRNKNMASTGTVGFLGLDELSLELAASLILSGFRVQAFEVSGPIIDKFVKLGGAKVSSPKDACTDATAITFLIPTFDHVNNVLYGEEGALKGFHDDVVVILRSTTSPKDIQKLENRLAEDAKTTFLVDAHVSKGTSESLQGKIMIISSGSSEAITKAKPFLSAMCERLYILEGGVGAGRVFKNHVPKLLKGDHSKHYSMDTIVRNLRSVLDMAKLLTFPLPLLAVAHQQLLYGCSRKSGDDYDTTFVKVYKPTLSRFENAGGLVGNSPAEVAKGGSQLASVTK